MITTNIPDLCNAIDSMHNFLCFTNLFFPLFYILKHWMLKVEKNGVYEKDAVQYLDSAPGFRFMIRRSRGDKCAKIIVFLHVVHRTSMNIHRIANLKPGAESRYFAASFLYIPFFCYLQYPKKKKYLIRIEGLMGQGRVALKNAKPLQPIRPKQFWIAIC
jgi:hypothetical protein